MQKADLLPFGMGKGILILLVMWFIASVLFGVDYVRHRLFGSLPPDDFAFYIVPALFIVFLMGGVLAVSIFIK